VIGVPELRGHVPIPKLPEYRRYRRARWGVMHARWELAQWLPGDDPLIEALWSVQYGLEQAMTELRVEL
jgi:hypothetical protein